MVLNHDNSQKRLGTVMDDEGLWCHDDGLLVTFAKNSNGTVMGW